jgi:acetylglutamate synthase
MSVISDEPSMTLRGQVFQQLRMFGAATQGIENDVAVGATALGEGIPLITTDNALANAVMKLGGEVRFLAP